MNPALILATVLFLSKNQTGAALRLPPPPALGKLSLSGIRDPVYFDTFKMELLLDRLRGMTNTLEKVNHLNQMKNVPLDRSNSLDRIEESLDAVRGLLYANKSLKNIDTLANTLSNVKQLGDMQGIMTNMAPILSMLSSKNDK